MHQRLLRFSTFAIGITIAISTACGRAETVPATDAAVSAKTVTVIDGRKFDFSVPDQMSSDLFEKVQDQFLIGALNTPSPPRTIWNVFDKLLIDQKQRTFIANYLSSKPPASAEEIQALLSRVKKGMIFVKGGTFDMGDYGWLTDKKQPMTSTALDDPPHKVELDSYSLMKNRVTFADYDLYTRANNLPPLGLDNLVAMEVRFPNFPALVNWQQGRDYCLWLAKETGQKFDIDTEAQYEYAARSGGKWLFLASTFEKPDELIPDQAKFKQFAESQDKDVSPDRQVGVPIGTYGHNYLGFEDMIGSVDEWVYDWFAPYTEAPLVNPRGPEKGDPKFAGDQKVARSAPAEVNDNYSTTRRLSHDPGKPYGAFRCSISSPQAWN